MNLANRVLRQLKEAEGMGLFNSLKNLKSGEVIYIQDIKGRKMKPLKVEVVSLDKGRLEVKQLEDSIEGDPKGFVIAVNLRDLAMAGHVSRDPKDLKTKGIK